MRHLLTIIVIVLTLSSCEKHRTEYLSDDQKEIIDAFTVGDTFTMLKNNTDTLEFLVTRADYQSESNGKWYENFGPHTWTERGRVLFETTNRVVKKHGSIHVYGDSPSNTADLLLDDIRPIDFITNVEAEINGTFLRDCILFHSDNEKYNIHDSAYISLNYGIIKIWNNEQTYLRLD